jgi:tRNA A-37 threonylcarbamoyl transferase component Bud32
VARRAPITREEFERGAGGNIAREAWYKPELRPIVVRGIPCLGKDYRRRPLWYRETVGRFSISRESAVYTALKGLHGIPGFLGTIDGHALLLERIDGADARDPPAGGFPPRFFDRLEEIVAGLHSRGVVHGDLRQRRNILVGPGGEPYLIDFTSSFRLPPDTFLFRMAAHADLSGVAKLRARHAPETLTETDRRRLALHRFRPGRRRRLAIRARRRSESEP